MPSYQLDNGILKSKLNSLFQDLVMFWPLERFGSCCFQYSNYDLFIDFLMVIVIMSVFSLEYVQSQKEDARKTEWNKLNRAKADEYEKILREKLRLKEKYNMKAVKKYSRYDLELGSF